ncbi:hypothetical protein [Leifsonia sp. EB34]|uniref:hypothetical protein n=1 Tax=Leifsonia sp. EB34 TaxID=3156303 RepID=UPI003518E65F
MTDVTDPTATAPESSRAPAPSRPNGLTVAPNTGLFDTDREAIMALRTPITGSDHGRR